MRGLRLFCQGASLRREVGLLYPRTRVPGQGPSELGAVMGQPIERRGEWFYEQPDGSWLKWNEAAGTWEALAMPPPPPGPGETVAPVAAGPAPSPTSEAVAPHSETPAPQGAPVQREVVLQTPQSHQPPPGHAVMAQSPRGMANTPSSEPDQDPVDPSTAAPGATEGAENTIYTGVRDAPPLSVSGYRSSLAQPATGYAQPGQASGPGYEPAPASGPTTAAQPSAQGARPPADSLIVSESYVVATQHPGTLTNDPVTAGNVRVEHVAPNVSQVTTGQVMTQNVVTQPVLSPPEQVRQMAIARLSEAERSNSQHRLAVLAGCLAPGERLVGLIFGVEQVTNHAGLIAVTDRQILFIGQSDGSTQLFCPLEQIELVGYEDVGGAARLSVTASGRVTTWRDIIPPGRAAEISQLVENQGAMARAVSPPPATVAPGSMPAGSPLIQTEGDVSVYHAAPRPSEIVIPEAQTEQQSLGLRARNFFGDLLNDPGSRSIPKTQSRYTSTSTTKTPRTSGSNFTFDARLMTLGLAVLSIVLGFIALGRWLFTAKVIFSALGIFVGYVAYERNRRTNRDRITEIVAGIGMIVSGVVLVLEIVRYFD